MADRSKRQLVLLKAFFGIVAIVFLGRALLVLVRDVGPDGSPPPPVMNGVAFSIVGGLSLAGFMISDYKMRVADGEEPERARRNLVIALIVSVPVVVGVVLLTQM